MIRDNSATESGILMRKILEGMICNKTLCMAISRAWGEGARFPQPPANIIAEWCIEHSAKYEPPFETRIETVFAVWVEKRTETEETINSVSGLIDALDLVDDPNQIQVGFLKDLAGEYFNEVRLKNALSEASRAFENGDKESAREFLYGPSSKVINIGADAYDEPFDDLAMASEAFNEEQEASIVTYPGDLGVLFGNAFQRGRLFSFMGSEKAGKTTWLVDFAIRALLRKLKVAYFECGDGSRNELFQKLYMRVSGKRVYAGNVAKIKNWDGDLPVVEREYENDDIDVPHTFHWVRKRIGKHKLRTFTAPAGSLSAEAIDDRLVDWRDDDGFIPDCILIDYCDILAPPKGVKDRLDQIDLTWLRLRRISQERHCLVMTATQVSALNYGRENYLLGKKDFQGRRTKFAHISGMIGISVSDKDRELGMARINKFAWRHGQHYESQFVQTVGCFDVGRPVLMSRFPKKKTETTADEPDKAKSNGHMNEKAVK